MIYGSYSLQGNTLKLAAHIMDVGALKIGPEIDHEAELPHLIDMLNSVAWRIVRRLDPSYSVAEQTFVAANANIRLDAFENYIRGLVEDEDLERIKHLKEAVRLSPDFYAAWLALGRAYFAHQDYELAATTLGKLPKKRFARAGGAVLSRPGTVLHRQLRQGGGRVRFCRHHAASA